MKPLFIFEMANNHSGSVEHGKQIIDAIAEKCIYKEFDYAFKFQYRNLDTFIHPDYKERFDIKNIKRFSDTRLSEEEFLEIKNYAQGKGFLTLCTPFDEDSVDKIVSHGYQWLKIASCSFTDWPLLEKIAQTNLPIIASTAGATTDEIKNVVSFFRHRKKEISIMHCVAEYPTKIENLQLNQIDYLKKLFPDVTVGYSTHESPDNYVAVSMAVAKGARIFEKHVGVETQEVKLNGYSANPTQVANWLNAAYEAYLMCGLDGERQKRTEKEELDLKALQRGAFAKRTIKKGELISTDDLYYAIPSIEGQVLANDMSKYIEFVAMEEIKVNQPVLFSRVETTDIREMVETIFNDVTEMIKKAGIVLADSSSFEISHHYGLKKFYETGTSIFECINREYCKKIIVMLPKQNHPVHKHLKKEETFQVLYGDITINLDGKIMNCKPGDIVTVERGVPHSFSSNGGGIFEEVSSTHYVDDSFYEDEAISLNKRRKTKLKYYKGTKEFND